MTTGIVYRILVVTALLSIGGCGATPLQTTGQATDKPILSAAEASSMIRVEFRNLEPASLEQTVASAD